MLIQIVAPMLLLWRSTAGAQSADDYVYKDLAGAVGGLVYEAFARSAGASSCSIDRPIVRFRTDDDIVNWAAGLFTPDDREKASSVLRSSLPSIRIAANDQVENRFAGFEHKSKTARATICAQLKISILKGETANATLIERFRWKP